MCRILAALLSICAVVVLTGHKAQPSPKAARLSRAQSELERPALSTVKGSDYDDHVHRHPDLEAVIRAHVRPDGPSADDKIITYHHMRDLASLSVRDQTIDSFFLFAASSLRGLRLYNCQIKSLAGIQHIGGIGELHLRGCNIRDITAFREAEIPSARFPPNPGQQSPRSSWLVTNLSLANNNIDDITPLSCCHDLTWLDLHDNNINSLAPLRTLRKLTYLDVRHNSLGKDAEADVLAIKVNNPGVRILLGLERGVGKEDLRQQLSARARIAEFARCVRWRYEDGIVGAMLVGATSGEELPEEISRALTCLAKGQDREYLPDIAAIFVKYLIEIEEHYLPGPVWDPNAALVKAFRVGAGMEGTYGEGLPAAVLGHWILDHRDRLAPSVFLDAQIERYRESHQRPG